jgi:hypothetical protein
LYTRKWSNQHDTPSFQTNIFWAPSLETAQKIDDEDTVKSIETAEYRFTASMADLERCYDEEAGRLRAAFVAEVAALYQSEAA